MKTPQIFLTITSILIISFYLFGCGGNNSEETTSPTMPSRPVTVHELQKRNFERESRLTGSVSLYREEQVGFEVGGRVLSVLGHRCRRHPVRLVERPRWRRARGVGAACHQRNRCQHCTALSAKPQRGPVGLASG